ncbi:MAG: baseplate J/gp47 family protein [Polyangiaceae bacterium]|nr:baseplate J/gp47 family protein [Polyangiaceae bacterium]
MVTIVKVTHLALPGWVADPSQSPAVGNVDVTLVVFDIPLSTPLAPWDSAQSVVLYGNVGKARFGAERTLKVSALESEFGRDPQNHVVEVRTDSLGGVTRYLRATRLPDGPVVHEALPDLPGKPESAPTVLLTINKEPWERRDHLHASRSYDRHYVATSDEDGSLWLQFGDGKNGMGVPVGTTASTQEIEVRYRIGDPVAGNVGNGVLVRFLPSDLTKITDFFDLTVINVTPGGRGRRPENRDAARLRLPATIRNGPLERAVTLPDYAAAARTVPGVARAAAKAVVTPFSTVFVLVDPKGSVSLDSELQQAVHARVDLVRMAGREHVVKPPVYIPIEVELALCAQPGTLRHRVRDAVLAALRPGSDASPGFFHPDRLTFGDDLDLGDLLAYVQGIAGVRAVKALVFRKMFVPGSPTVANRILLGPTEVLRLDADDDRPENGRLSVKVVGLDPSLKESDFVVEVTP